jgi:hypothetical protein
MSSVSAAVPAGAGPGEGHMRDRRVAHLPTDAAVCHR